MITTTTTETNVADFLFMTLNQERKNKIEPAKLLKQLTSSGILQDDPRIQALFKTFYFQVQSKKRDGIGRNEFNRILKQNALIKKTLSKNLIIPDFKTFCQQIETIFLKTQKNKKGKVAGDIPKLAGVNPEQFAMTLCTVDGQRFSLGDSITDFCLQSLCEPINYCLALEEFDERKEHTNAGCETSVQPLNGLASNMRGLHQNYISNTETMMSSSLIEREKTLVNRFNKVLTTWEALTGGKKANFNKDIYGSERQTGDCNFAQTYFMRAENNAHEQINMTETLALYFQCCSLEYSTYDISVAAATMANTGKNPLTGDVIFKSATIHNCLSLMLGSETRDFSGEFTFKIGLPAKSGVSGALMLVIPNVMGISIWSPRLDESGSSVRGVEFCHRLIEHFSFRKNDWLTVRSA